MTDRQKRDFKHMYEREDIYSNTDIGMRFGIAKSQVGEVAKTLGLPPRHLRNKDRI
jgi:hypothetical protein